MYRVLATATFTAAVRRHRKNRTLLVELDQKIARLRTNPQHVGGRLAGILHGYHSTRLARNYRLLFSIQETGQTVTLEALDHRKDVYD